MCNFFVQKRTKCTKMWYRVLVENHIACCLYPKLKKLYYYNFDKYEIPLYAVFCINDYTNV